VGVARSRARAPLARSLPRIAPVTADGMVTIRAVSRRRQLRTSFAMRLQEIRCGRNTWRG
jgi:hypothetical protein